jgi:hypothetical protein
MRVLPHAHIWQKKKLFDVHVFYCNAWKAGAKTIRKEGKLRTKRRSIVFSVYTSCHLHWNLVTTAGVCKRFNFNYIQIAPTSATAMYRRLYYFVRLGPISAVISSILLLHLIWCVIDSQSHFSTWTPTLLYERTFYCTSLENEHRFLSNNVLCSAGSMIIVQSQR